MGLFSFTQEIAMDLGTANTIIITNGKIVVDEPSVVALDRRTDKMIAVGEKAKLMHEKTHENIRTIRPLRDGVIADFYACEQMMRGLIKRVNTRNHLFSPSLRMVIGVPSGSTEVELRAVRDSAEHAGGRDVYLIFEPMAAAIGIGIDVEAPEGNMIVDIGGGSTEIAVISLGGIVSNNSIRVAGDDLTEDIREYMSRQHNVKSAFMIPFGFRLGLWVIPMAVITRYTVVSLGIPEPGYLRAAPYAFAPCRMYRCIRLR